MDLLDFNRRCDRVAGVPKEITELRERNADIKKIGHALTDISTLAFCINFDDNSPAYHKFYETLKSCCEEYGSYLARQLTELHQQLETLEAQHDR